MFVFSICPTDEGSCNESLAATISPKDSPKSFDAACNAAPERVIASAKPSVSIAKLLAQNKIYLTMNIFLLCNCFNLL